MLPSSNLCSALLRRLALGLCFASAMVLPALAGPPFETDDPVPADFRHFEINVFAQYKHDFQTTTGTAPSAEINYGILRNVEVTLLLPVGFSNENGSTRFGAGDVELASMYRFVKQSGWLPEIALAPAFQIATGDPVKKLGNGSGTSFLPIWLQWKTGPWTIFGGGGLRHNRGAGAQDSWFSGIAVQAELDKHTMIGAEFFHTTPESPDGDGTKGTNLTLTRELGDDQHLLLLALGRSLHANSLHAYAGYQILLGPKSKAKSGAGD